MATLTKCLTLCGDILDVQPPLRVKRGNAVVILLSNNSKHSSRALQKEISYSHQLESMSEDYSEACLMKDVHHMVLRECYIIFM